MSYITYEMSYITSHMLYMTYNTNIFINTTCLFKFLYIPFDISMTLLWKILLGIFLIGRLSQSQDLLEGNIEQTALGEGTEGAEDVEEPEGPETDVSQPDHRQPCAMWMGGVPGTPGYSGKPGRDGRDGRGGPRGEKGDKG